MKFVTDFENIKKILKKAKKIVKLKMAHLLAKSLSSNKEEPHKHKV